MGCYNCAYKQVIPGNTHVQCMFDFQKAKMPMPKGDETGIKNGWFVFPINYDPNWMLEECRAHSTTKDPEMIREDNLMIALIAILDKKRPWE